VDYKQLINEVKVFLHTNAIENRMLIKSIRIDFYGDDLFKASFQFHQNADESMLIIRVSDRTKHESFKGHFSIN